MNILKCYMCEKDSTSREHVPPLCLFPEMKDTKGIDFRKDLITVPSCDIHNSKKSDDDEFLMFTLSGLIKNNPIGKSHQFTKASRALKRKNKDFLEKEILRKLKTHKIESTDGNFRMIAVGYPNAERLSDCLKHIAYGLFYNEFNHKFDGEVKMIFEFLNYKDETKQKIKSALKDQFRNENMLRNNVKGKNPLVFYYEFIEPDNFGLIAMRTVFYGTAEAYFVFIPKKPNESLELFKKFNELGNQTIVSFNGENFKINK